MDQISGALQVLFASNAMAMINLMALVTGRKPSPEFFEPLTWALYELGRETTGAQYQIAVGVMQIASRQIAAFFENYDAWLSPTLGAPPVKLGTIDVTETDLNRAIETLLHYVPFTPAFNMTGQPAVSLPLHANAEGLPIGVHVVGRFGDEGLLYRLSGQLEKECPWIDRKPPIWD
jgi:amidase